MEKELAKAYDPSEFEEEIYKFWESNEFFRPETQIKLGLVDRETSPRFCITIPLPNITGRLHQGHAMTISIEDLMTRYARMQQKETLFMPGTDHAGIATQSVVERELLKQGIKRKKLGRKKFVEKVWEWKEIYHARITEQSKKMGMSSDWIRERFTLDEVCTRAVREAFYRLYQKGLIYRGEYMVNWCPRCESAISDLETEPKDTSSHLWYIKYPVLTPTWKGPKSEWGSGNWAKGAKEFIVVATTRPETLLGDTGVATTPDHNKFSKFVGQNAILPILGRQIPIFSDKYVDPEVGTGALKVTPGHDPNDFEIGVRHDLDVVTVLDEKARLLPHVSGPYAGMKREEGRTAIVKDLEQEGLLVKIEPYVHTEPHCQRCATVIEPRVSIQWFVKTKPLAEAAMEKVRKGETVIIPKREEKRFFQWMENIRDWCISRQLWWGHRIPIWYCEDCSEEICPSPNVDELAECSRCGSKNLVKEEDVLDTWFSSGLWTFSTLHWPDTSHPDFQRFYPTDTRETGYDILFFWVAREMMLGNELTGVTPYRTVYLHGIIRDERGRKISKSMEDVEEYDPLNIIKEYGADCLRFVLISNTIPGIDINLDPRQLEAAHRFANKVWQSAKYVLSHVQKGETFPTLDEIAPTLRFADKWILSRLHQTVRSVTASIEEMDYLKAARDIKNFYWSEFCDWYLEISKIRLHGINEEVKVAPKVILLHVLDTTLRLLHPIMPFVTEKLWQRLPNSIRVQPALIVTEWPKYRDDLIDIDLEKEFLLTMELIREIRRIRGDYNVNLGAKIPFLINPGEYAPAFEATREEIVALAKLDPQKLVMSSILDSPQRAARVVLPEITAYVPLEEIIDLEKEKQRIEINLTKITKDISATTYKLNGPFGKRAPPEIVEREKGKLSELEIKKSLLEDQLRILS
ncbi:MAG: valine--tRNA ligase [Candidatus Thorarchaeota archaeon]